MANKVVVMPNGHGFTFLYTGTGEIIEFKQDASMHTQEVHDDEGWNTPDALEAFSIDTGEF